MFLFTTTGEDHILFVLNKLRQNSLVNDHGFAREWVENRNRFKPRGKRALSSELYQKGISIQIIEEVLLDLDEEELALRYGHQILPKLKHLDKKVFQEKLYGYLSRRGFSYGISKVIISTLLEEHEE